MADKTIVVDDEYFVCVFKHNYIALKNQIEIYESYFDKKDSYERVVDVDFRGSAIKTERKIIQSENR